jgi:hypothetical protein
MNTRIHFKLTAARARQCVMRRTILQRCCYRNQFDPKHVSLPVIGNSCQIAAVAFAGMGRSVEMKTTNPFAVVIHPLEKRSSAIPLAAY